MTRPQISVVMPCYNAREFLPWALGSLIAQTCEDWELVLVDDGSADRPEEIVEQMADARVRLIRLPENRGRSHARQVALDGVRGEFIAMLDADDWMYPHRLESQRAMLHEHGAVGLVSAGMAIVDGVNDLSGVRGTGDGVPRLAAEGILPGVSHGASMLRRAVVGTTTFDPRLLTGEDQDFLQRALRGSWYAVLPDVMYVYSELRSVDSHKAAEAQRMERIRIRRDAGMGPAARWRAIGRSYAMQSLYAMAGAIGADEAAIRRRSRAATAIERAAFALARERVSAVVKQRFGAVEGFSARADERG